MKLIRADEAIAGQVSHNERISKKTFLRPDDLPHLVQFAQATFPQGEVALAHSHTDMHEVFLIQSGEAAMKVDDQVFPLSAGDCVTVAAGEEHELVNMGVDDLVVTYFGLKV